MSTAPDLIRSSESPVSSIVFVQFLLSCESGAISRLRSMAASARIVTANPSVHELLDLEGIEHAYHAIRDRDWQQVNGEIFEQLKYHGGESGAMLDTWSHWLVSEVNHVFILGQSMLSLLRDGAVNRLVVKHAQDDDAFATLRSGLSQHLGNQKPDIIDWDDAHVRA